MKKCLFALVIVLTWAGNYAYSQTTYQLQNAFPNLSFSTSVDLQHAGDGTDRLFVVEQAGRIRVFQNLPNVSSTKLFLDITDRVSSGGEMGLLGLAFHPDYKNNGYFYVNYTTSNPRTTRISRFRVSTVNPDSADKNSELILLSFSQPYSNHNGGQVGFGPDGYLYIATGDGGSAGDPQNNSQTKSNLLGKILRIDVDNTQGNLNYAIPPDNPFYNNTQGFSQEIYAWGLRNPWRFSFDPVTGWLWCGDVGQNAREEIDLIWNGHNYGWKIMEGSLCYSPSSGCDTTGLTLPIWEYPHSQGYSVTGGHVYRGPNQPGLEGKYIYADYGTRRVWALEYDGVNPPVNTLLLTMSGNPSSFGVDMNNELYVVTLGGTINKFVPTAAIVAPSNLQVTFGGSGDIMLTWNDNSNNESGFRIERKIDNGNFELIDSVSQNVTSFTDFITETGTYTYRIYAFNQTDVSGFSNTASIVVTTVPVELSTFSLSAGDNKVILEWSTSTEQNNYGFAVERLMHNNWSEIAFIRGHGTTTQPGNYRYIDDFETFGFSGTVGYRLKQIDLDGSFSYSIVKEIELDFEQKDYSLEQNYPNPFNPETTIKFSIPEESNVKIQVINVLGKTVSVLADEIKQAGKHELIWNASEFASGVYYLRIEAGSVSSGRSFSQVKKMVYLK